MELLSNLIWLVVALALWAVWLTRPRSALNAPPHHRIGAQLTALAVLTLVLLPVISLSDDLRAAQNPAEVERTCVRNDQHLQRPHAVPPSPVALAVVISFLLLPSPRTLAYLRPPSLPSSEGITRIRVSASRPPPAAL